MAGTKTQPPATSCGSWFGHIPELWPEFKRRHFAELVEKPDSWQEILRAAIQGKITLLYAAQDREHNNAVALREYLEARLGGRGDRAD